MINSDYSFQNFYNHQFDAVYNALKNSHYTEKDQMWIYGELATLSTPKTVEKLNKRLKQLNEFSKKWNLDIKIHQFSPTVIHSTPTPPSSSGMSFKTKNSKYDVHDVEEELELFSIDDEVEVTSVNPKTYIHHFSPQQIQIQAEKNNISDRQAIEKLQKTKDGHLFVYNSLSNSYSIIYKKNEIFFKQEIVFSQNGSELSQSIEILKEKKTLTENIQNKEIIQQLGEQNVDISNKEAKDKLFYDKFPYLVTYNKKEKKYYIIHYYTTQHEDFIVKSLVRFTQDGIQLRSPEPLYEITKTAINLIGQVDLEEALENIKTAATYSKRFTNRNHKLLFNDLNCEAELFDSKDRASKVKSLNDLMKKFEKGRGDEVVSYLKVSTIKKQSSDDNMLATITKQAPVFGPQSKNSETMAMENILHELLRDYESVKFKFKDRKLFVRYRDTQTAQIKTVDMSPLLTNVNFNHISLSPSCITKYENYLTNSSQLGYKLNKHKFNVKPENQSAFDEKSGPCGKLRLGEKKAINIYTGKMYTPMNLFLRGEFKAAADHILNDDGVHSDYQFEEDKRNQAYKECLLHCAVAIAALNQIPDYRDDKYLFRCEGNGVPDEVIKNRIKAVNDGGGVTLEMGLISTAYHKPAESFISSDTKAFIIFHVRNGKNVTQVSQYGKSEREILLPPTQIYWKYHKEVKAKNIDNHNRDVHLFYALPMTVDTHTPVLGPKEESNSESDSD